MALEENQIYHEKQRLQFCLLHALNNLLQEKNSFTRSELDAIANRLVLNDPSRNQWSTLVPLIFKPHHNTFTGNYDVNVLMAALEARRKRMVWHDRRNAASTIKLSEENLLGIMVNLRTGKLGGLLKGRHWVTLRSINGSWYNLDSDLNAPKPFQNEEEVRKFLDYVISQDGEVLIVLHETS